MQILSPLVSLTRGKRLLGGLSLVLPYWLGVLAGPLVAQDVVVGEPQWAARGGPLEKIPSVTERLRVMYPAEMRKTDEIGYVFQRRVIGPEGATRVLRIEGNLHPFSREVAEATREMRFSVRPGELPSEVARGVAIVFNPKSASTTGPDATARLIAPAVV